MDWAAMSLLPPLLLSLTLPFPRLATATPFVVQRLSSRYALLLGGYGPGYEELNEVEVVKHDRVCQGAVAPVPSDPGRFLGAVSGLAETVGDGGDVLFCRHNRCWRLFVAHNQWRPAGGFTSERDRAASASVGESMVVLGGVGVGVGEEKEEGATAAATATVEEYDKDEDRWVDRPEWAMQTGRYSFCAVPVNDTSLMVAGGYTGAEGAEDSVEILNTATDRWERAQSLPRARYGHACLLMEWSGRPGVLAVGGALTGRDAVFYDLSARRWESFPSLPYSVDGHAVAMVEGIPVVFSWRRAIAFDGVGWRHAPELAPTRSRSAFAAVAIPGHLVSGCQ